MTYKPEALCPQDLIQRSVYLGHKACRGNPKMAPYIYKKHDGVHIIDLVKTRALFERALMAIYTIAEQGGRILFVGTKPHARELIKTYAQKCGQYYVDHRWTGGMLTNWKTVSASIRRLKELEEKLASPEIVNYVKKEQLQLTRLRDGLERKLGGIKEMGALPDVIFVVDVVEERIAVKEAQKLNIPIVAIVDTNADPEGIDYIVPGNDDSSGAVELYCSRVCDAVLAGLQSEMEKSGKSLKSARVGKPGFDEQLLTQLTERFKQVESEVLVPKVEEQVPPPSQNSLSQKK
ncbi:MULTISPECIES: 30S ribosomal protein S2 [Holospora]|uniref:Small ribosomal subunit protein uS2 n=2 Tax=Holospora TaxID=44747 RepID=A0A061JFX5_9PROT|nr:MULTISPECIES: 30S ribosomal protein S2 [Holospora]ETZ04625.1 30S ribosomal protein S2 [Holospora undulata HU1]GAJ46064.1 30S ribosomal protein S2 [Holospora elegans E1]